MKSYGIEISEGAAIENLTTPSGTAFPANDNVGEFFYRTDLDALYVRNNSTWQAVTAPVGGGGATNKVVSFLSASGANGMMVLVDNEIYTTASTTTDGSDYCTGRGTTGQNPLYGLKSLSVVSLPTTGTITQIGGNMRQFAFALVDNGELWTWGQNSNGACGLGNTTITPLPVLAATGVTDVYTHPTNAGITNTNSRLVIKKTDGYLYGAGYNATNGALGLGNLTNQNTFVQLTALGNSIKSAWNMGATNGCLIVQKGDDTIWAAGYNINGELGDGTILTKTTHVDVTTAWGGGAGKILTQVITTSNDTTNALGMLLDDGTNTTFMMSGHNVEGALGDGTLVRKTTPITPNVGAGRIAKIAMANAAGTVQCLKEDNVMYAWGRNDEGCIGNGVANATKVSTPVIILSDVIDLYSDGSTSSSSAQLNQSFIKRTDNALWGCGTNTNSNLGLGYTSTNVPSFTKALLPTGYDIADIGFFGNNAVKTYVSVSTDGKLFAWGYAANSRFQAPSNGPTICRTPIELELTEDNA